MKHANKEEKREKLRKSTAKITREDIEKAMREFKGEIKYLKVEDSLYESNPANCNPYGYFNFKREIS